MRQTGLPLRLLEIGVSAGLNLRWDHFPFLRRRPKRRHAQESAELLATSSPSCGRRDGRAGRRPTPCRRVRWH
ncbi:MAG: DUF2332 family protein [Vicinamibacterales bacterium]